ncbi:AsnC family transcriptional regulator [Hasllibacter halocynthiae]|uniref:AsnC family transcriptional regulator n=1 Tax=Hasllibacter halocynthiae TaxID=595589 RepID=A0A2T0X750_9RHOB|nr:Lrp/AsnC family transcriptional regulator [Hasllibacter halocynthiae]PRY94759.1 AsnC family transcriptional regulator [Hasllibacter halocynthiae]
MDDTDREILRLLQRDARLTSDELGRRLGLSASQAGRRRQRLEEGPIRGYAACIDPGAAGLGVQAFVQVGMASHGRDEHAAFARLAETLPEVTEAFTLTGDADYLLRVWCADLAALNRLVQERLLPHSAVGRVRSQIVMQQLKAGAPLPV